MMNTTYKFLCIALIVGSVLSCGGPDQNSSRKEPVDYVNPYIGSISHLLVPTFPTTHLPNSMLRVHPLRSDYTSEILEGLPLILPKHRRSGIFRLCPMTEKTLQLLENPKYTYDQEIVTPYSYSVYLDEIGVQVDFSPSHQAALYKLNFLPGDSPIIALKLDDGMLLKNSTKSISGFGTYKKPSDYFLYEGEAKYYLNMEFDQEPVSVEIIGKMAVVKFSPATSPIGIRYGISLIDTDQARKNLEREISGFDMDKLVEAGKDLWNESLGKIRVEGNENDKTIFYTALYRTYERMINISEDGRYYSAFDGHVHDDQGIPFYTDDWVWDTYLAAHPLHALINPEIQSGKIASYIRMFEQSGWMPTFPTPSGDDANMYGYHTVAMVWDAYAKGLRGFDLARAYEGCRKSALYETMLPWKKDTLSALDVFFQKNGYYPALHPGETETHKEVNSWEKRQSVAITLAASYDDWCLAQIAQELSKQEDYEFFMKRSLNYRNLFNPVTGFFHPKDEQGNFVEPFDYTFAGGQGARDYYSENNGWTFRWGVQHNIADLIQLMGGNDKFTAALDETFAAPMGKPKYEFFRQLPDHSGVTGQVSMGNEPSFHIPYLYNYAGQPWKTQKHIRALLNQWFRNDLMGLPGDEDGGGMSAFVVFSMMGFYPVIPGIPVYNIGSPVFSHVKLELGNGKYFEIEAVNASAVNKYVQSATINGKPLNNAWFRHADIAEGGKLVLEMGDKADKSWGTGEPPPSGKY